MYHVSYSFPSLSLCWWPKPIIFLHFSLRQTERALSFEIAQFQEALAAAVTDLMPNRLCSYVYSLCGKATDFLEACHVLTNPDRLLLVQATCAVLDEGLRLLGIQPLKKI